MKKSQVPKEIKETVFSYVDVDQVASLTTYEKKWINKIHALAEKYPDQVRIVAENDDGTICAHVPKKWFKFSPPRQVSEKQKVRMSELGKAMVRKKKENDETKE